MRHFAEQDRPQNLPRSCAGHFGENIAPHHTHGLSCAQCSITRLKALCRNPSALREDGMVGTGYKNGTTDRDFDAISNFPPVNIRHLVDASRVQNIIAYVNVFNILLVNLTTMINNVNFCSSGETFIKDNSAEC
ncbi:MAG: hypothetical protein ACP5QR_05125 [Rhizomicrobium sp.]